MDKLVRNTISWLSQIGVAEIDYTIDGNNYVTHVSCYQPGIDRCLKLSPIQQLHVEDVVLYVYHNYRHLAGMFAGCLYISDLIAIKDAELLNKEQTT